MRRLFFICFVFWSALGMSQDKKIDQLEILYDQGYYSKVSRKASKLIANPEYDYSGLPSFYKALALFRMSNDEVWFKRHDDAIDQAVSAYQVFMDNPKIKDYVAAHYHEISSLKTYLVDLETRYKSFGLNAAGNALQSFRLNELKGIKAQPDIAPIKETKPKEEEATLEVTEAAPKDLSFRQKLVVYAKSLVGIKYKWAGTDKSGFDCSGLIGYVHRKYGINVPRTASAQQSGAKKVKVSDAFQGDLLFFSSGKNISHVGMVINTKGSSLMMVHASTSKGVIITEIEKSTYWKPKLKSAGTFI